jgi:ABC-type polysaccharide/polyol phosphate transport system ATPase subunit
MGNVVIKVDGLSKRYRLGERVKYKALRDILSQAIKVPFQKAQSLFRPPNAANGSSTGNTDWLWALKDVSFEITRGEIVGIIGHNGAGKSTLLKLLSRVTAPTAGSAEIHGTVGSLLEVGTGFHPELTGRENIYLNGAILGMSKRAIASRFDQIVSFSELERFIDTPVKHYSSGMYVRLGFAVAAHLEPDILLVDEVLAVGDAGFWSKCISKIKDLIAQGTTIFLVTHNMWLVQTLCSRAICFDKGSVAKDTTPLEAIGYYKGLNPLDISNNRQATKSNRNLLMSSILDFSITPIGNWVKPNVASPDSGMKVSIKAKICEHKEAIFLVRVTSPDGFPFFTIYSDTVPNCNNNILESNLNINTLMLKPGNYLLWGAICTNKGEDNILDADSIPFAVESIDEPTNQFSLFYNWGTWQINFHTDIKDGPTIENPVHFC